MARPLIIDTDGGVDDALAILLALASPEVELLAITTVAGNVDVKQATENVQRVVTLSGTDQEFPIAPGVDQALMGGVLDAASIHGDDGLGNLVSYVEADGSLRYSPVTAPAEAPNAIDVLLQAIRDNPEELTIVEIGPMTNLAICARIDPENFAKVGTIVVMGGTVDLPGNIAPYGEFNIWADPEAAAIALAANPNITLVGLDASVQAFLPRTTVDSWVAQNPNQCTLFIRDCTRMYMDFYQTYENVDGCYMHDPLALAVAIDPSLVTRKPFGFEVETQGHTRGMFVADRRPRAPKDPRAKVDVAWDVDVNRLFDLIGERLGGVSPTKAAEGN